MIKNVEVEFEPTPDELAKEICEWDAEQQANFLYELAYLYRFHVPDFLTQLQAISDEINCEDDAYNKALIVRILETVLKYIKAEEGDSK